MNHRERVSAARSRKALVIGGTQFIGRSLVSELLKAGHEVWVLHRKPEHDIFIQLMKLKNTLRWMRGEDLITHLGLEYYD